ncbi:hypothetical protein F5146DRAFT_936166, partial [Armillaria mellea]
GSAVSFDMAGVVYYGGHHFTAQYIDKKSNIWYNDSIIHGRSCILEGQISMVNMKQLPNGREHILFLYMRRYI